MLNLEHWLYYISRSVLQLTYFTLLDVTTVDLNIVICIIVFLSK